MSSGQTTTSFGAIDAPTTRFLARAAKDIDYLLKDCSPTPTDERFYKEGVETYRVGQLEIDGAVISIYSFDAGRVFNTLQERTDEPDEEISQFFAVDWPVQQEDGQSYHSFYFKNRPCEERIRQAHCIHKVKIAIENRELPQEFRCENCSERVHWTNLTEDCDMTLMERVIMLEKQVCNCEGSLNLLKEGMDEESVTSPTVATGSTLEPAASSLD
ncbi:hypothetical protein [Halosimplex pelagicum]|uniref:Uncharacterized protein n=1 Tax=Halosimplex pelagicum TaxID=869886 RepID=A0A7D5TA09_9EURY|nr:hypothetical protein [Halosimplex pelagicum]QLH82390.1 hypothetical protein HZS54_12520 [Halosimplex pelagicum]